MEQESTIMSVKVEEFTSHEKEIIMKSNRLNNFQTNVTISNKERLQFADKVQKQIYKNAHDYKTIKKQKELENNLK
jgi:hypothetical protein